jgi:hypothetical protein
MPREINNRHNEWLNQLPDNRPDPAKPGSSPSCWSPIFGFRKRSEAKQSGWGGDASSLNPDLHRPKLEKFLRTLFCREWSTIDDRIDPEKQQEEYRRELEPLIRDATREQQEFSDAKQAYQEVVKAGSKEDLEVAEENRDAAKKELDATMGAIAQVLKKNGKTKDVSEIIFEIEKAKLIQEAASIGLEQWGVNENYPKYQAATREYDRKLEEIKSFLKSHGKNVNTDTLKAEIWSESIRKKNRQEIKPLIGAIINAEIPRKEAKKIYDFTKKTGANAYNVKLELNRKMTDAANARNKLIEFLYEKCGMTNKEVEKVLGDIKREIETIKDQSQPT